MIAAHDLKSPLNSISGLIRVIRDSHSSKMEADSKLKRLIDGYSWILEVDKGTIVSFTLLKELKQPSLPETAERQNF